MKQENSDADRIKSQKLVLRKKLIKLMIFGKTSEKQGKKAQLIIKKTMT